MRFFKISSYTHILYLETRHTIQVFGQNIISFQWQTTFSNLEDSALSRFRARGTAGKQPYPKSSPNLHYSTQNLAIGASSEEGPQCSQFHTSPKCRMLWKQGLLQTKRWPFPSHNFSKFPPQQQKHYREPNYTASLGPGSWEAEQHPLSKSTLIVLYQGRYTLPLPPPRATAFCVSVLVTLLWNNWVLLVLFYTGVMRQKNKGLVHMDELLESSR